MALTHSHYFTLHLCGHKMFFHKLTHMQGGCWNFRMSCRWYKSWKTQPSQPPFVLPVILFFWHYFWPFVRLKYLCIRMTKILQQLFCIHIVYFCPFCMLLIQLLGLVNSWCGNFATKIISSPWDYRKLLPNCNLLKRKHNKIMV